MPSLIDAGLDVVHPIQKHTMDEAQVVREFGGQITFLAGIDVQHILQEEDTEGVRAEVRHMIDTFEGPDGGMCIAAGNGIVSGTPYENMVPWEDVDLLTSAGRKKIEEAWPHGQVCAWGWDGTSYTLLHPLLSLADRNLYQWQAYWYRAYEEDAQLIIPSQERAAEKQEHFRMFEEGDWCVRLEVRAGEWKDTDNFLGVSSNLTRADEGIFNVEEPPMMSPYLDLYFPGPVRYATRFLPAREVRLEWEFEVTTDLEGEQITLT